MRRSTVPPGFIPRPMSLGPYSNQHITNQFNGKQTTTKSSVCCCPCDFLGVLSPVFLCSDKTTALSLRAPPGGQPSPLGHEGGSTCAESNDSSMKPTGLDLNFLQVQSRLLQRFQRWSSPWIRQGFGNPVVVHTTGSCDIMSICHIVVMSLDFNCIYQTICF